MRRVISAPAARPAANLLRRKMRENPDNANVAELGVGTNPGASRPDADAVIVAHAECEEQRQPRSRRAPAVTLDDQHQQSPVHRVEALLVHLQHLHGRRRDRAVDNAVAFDLGIVAHAPEQSVRHAWRATAALGDLMRAALVDGDRGALQRVVELGPVVRHEFDLAIQVSLCGLGEPLLNITHLGVALVWGYRRQMGIVPPYEASPLARVAAPTSITPVRSIPLPKNTVAKNLSSNRPIRSMAGAPPPIRRARLRRR